MGHGRTLTSTEYAAALLELGLGNYTAARVCFPPDWERDGSLAAFGAADYVEAAARGGDVPAARSAVERFEARAHAPRTPPRCWGCSHGAKRSWPRAKRSSRSTALRSHSWRRRRRPRRWHDPGCSTASGSGARNRPLDAREQLRLALESFEAIGAAAFAERTRAELLAAGGRAGRSNRESPTDLTPREAQVARWRHRAPPTSRSPVGCSSARTPSTTTCGRCTESWGSRRGDSSARVELAKAVV